MGVDTSRRRRALLALGVALALGSGVAAFLAWRARQPFTLEDPEMGPVSALGFDPSGRWLVGGDPGGGICVWSLETRALLVRAQRPDLHGDEGVFSVSFTGDGLLVVGPGGSPVVFQRLPDLTQVRSFEDPTRNMGSSAARAAGAFVAHVATGQGEDGVAEIHLWDVSKKEPALVQRWKTGSLSWLALTPNGERVVAAIDDRPVAAPHVTTFATHAGTLLAEVPGWKLGRVGAVAPVGSVLAAGVFERAADQPGGSMDPLRVELHTFDGTLVRTLQPEEPSQPTGEPRKHADEDWREVGSIAFSPDGRLVAATFERLTMSGGDVSSCVHAWLEVWDAASGERLLRRDLGQASSEAVAFSTTGEWLAVACGARVLVLRP